MDSHPTKGNTIVKLNRTGMAAGLIAGALALAACSSSGGGNTGGNSGGDTGGSTGGATNANCFSGSLKSDGSTAQQSAMDQWIKDYQGMCSGATITYGGGGSGQGITDFTSNQVDFAGSDAALDPSAGEVKAANKACGSPAMDIPMVTGPIAIAYNVSGVKKLVLTADEVAKIFTGKITKWNDSEIAASNKGVNLPSANITVFNRSDDSGTTQNFESYMAASAPSVWTKEPSKTWAGVGQGKNGNPLVGKAVQSTPNSIGYVEWSYAIQNNLPEAEIDNGAGPVELSSDTVGKTVDTATVASNGNPGDLTLKLDYATKTKGAYPILLVTYEIVCSTYKNASTGKAVKSFLSFIASSKEQAAIHNLGYAALPSGVASKVMSSINTIK
jgi:phosphate transport system substrate-binding protein